MTHTIDSADLRVWLVEGRPVTVLDVRPVDQRRDWFIPGSLHADLYQRLKTEGARAIEGLDLPADRPVVTVCEAGVTSAIAAEGLAARGYHALSLSGGMNAWSGAWNTAGLALASGTRVVQVRRTGKGCLSYLLVSQGEALVIDAALDPQTYLDLAAQRGARIVAAVDTHVHADHLSRSRALTLRLGVPLHLPAQDRVRYPHTPLADGDQVAFGSTNLHVLRTPGHTWESSSYLLEGEAIFTGDTLFVDGVGRPDLEARAGEARERAAALHASLQRLLTLPGDMLALPGHSSRPIPFDGEILGATLAEARASSELLMLDREAFVERVTARVPPTPENHRRIVALNEAGELPDDTTELEAGGNRCAIG